MSAALTPCLPSNTLPQEAHLVEALKPKLDAADIPLWHAIVAGLQAHERESGVHSFLDWQVGILYIDSVDVVGLMYSQAYAWWRYAVRLRLGGDAW